MGMTKADWVYSCFMETEMGPNGELDYKKLCDKYHESMERVESQLSLAVSALELAKEKLERSDNDGTQSDTYWEVVNTLDEIKGGEK